MFRVTGCCLLRLILLAIMLAIVIGIVWYAAPAVKHDLEKIGHDRRAREAHQNDHGKSH